METTLGLFEGSGDTPAQALVIATKLAVGASQKFGIPTSVSHIVVEVLRTKEGLAPFWYASIAIIFIKPMGVPGLEIPRPGQLLPHA